MNFKDKISEIKRIKGLMLGNYPSGCIKLTQGESEIHARVKSQVAHWLLNNDYLVYSEPTLKYLKSRPDLLGLHKSGIAYIFEIVNSESDKSIERKKETYPLPIIVIDVNKFKYEDLKI